jgi:hypothetical protein
MGVVRGADVVIDTEGNIAAAFSRAVGEPRGV